MVENPINGKVYWAIILKSNEEIDYNNKPQIPWSAKLEVTSNGALALCLSEKYRTYVYREDLYETENAAWSDYCRKTRLWCISQLNVILDTLLTIEEHEYMGRIMPPVSETLQSKSH